MICVLDIYFQIYNSKAQPKYNTPQSLNIPQNKIIARKPDLIYTHELIVIWEETNADDINLTDTMVDTSNGDVSSAIYRRNFSVVENEIPIPEIDIPVRNYNFCSSTSFF